MKRVISYKVNFKVIKVEVNEKVIGYTVNFINTLVKNSIPMFPFF